MLKNFLLAIFVGTALTNTPLFAMEEVGEVKRSPLLPKQHLTDQDIEEKYLMEDEMLELCLNLWECGELAPTARISEMEQLDCASDFTSRYSKAAIRGIHILGILNRQNNDFFNNHNNFKMDDINIKKINPYAYYVCHLNQDMATHGWLQWEHSSKKASFNILQLSEGFL